MTCEEYCELWQRQLDGESLVNQLEVQDHLQACPACLALQRAAAGMSTLRPAPVPPWLCSRIVEAHVRERRRNGQRHRLRYAIGLAAAACLMALVGLVPAPESRQARPAMVPVQTTSARQGTLGESVQEVGDVVASLTTRTAGATVAGTRELLPEVPRPLLSDLHLQSTLKPPVQALREASAGVTTSLAPVGQSAQRAVELFLRGLPGDTAKPS